MGGKFPHIFLIKIMSIYTPDIFYNNNHLKVDEKKELCREGHNKCFKWWADHMVGVQRQMIEMEFETILAKLEKSSHFVFIHRKGYEDWRDKEWFEDRWCLEIGFNEGIYYLWILIVEDEIPHFIKKYKLTPM